jgi:hypothetical protein
MSSPRTPQETDLEAHRQHAQSRRTGHNSISHPTQPYVLHIYPEPGSVPQQPNGDVNRLGVNEGPTYAPKHGDASATYWKLHKREAEIYDKNFVESLMGNTNSMVILVRGDPRR